jgi:hypothetical protein
VETLAERIARDGPVNELDAIGWAIRLAKRLEALHKLGVAHGSVSPACVIAAGQDRNARAYLAEVQHTSPSPAYQSPERLMGGDISAADDTWAVAATLHALLTGQSPFAAASDAEVRQKIMAASPAPLAVFDVGDDDLQHILDRAFAREMAGRTTHVAMLRRALEEWHPDRGVSNLPPLEDEDSTNDDDDDGARTMMVSDQGGVLRDLGREIAARGGPGPAPYPVAPLAGPPGPAPYPVAARPGGPGPAPYPMAPRPGGPGPAPYPTAPRPGGPGPAPYPMAARPGGPGPAPYPMAPPAAPPPARPPMQAPAPPPAQAGPIPRVNADDDDEDDDNVRTVMREMPHAEIAAAIAERMKGQPGAYPGGPPGPAPYPVAPLGPAPYPVAARPPGAPPQPFGGGAPFPPAFGGRPPPAPAAADDDEENDNARTMMRAPDLVEEDSQDVRTAIAKDQPVVGWKGAAGPPPRPAAGMPVPGGAAPAPPAISQAAWDGPIPASTMAMDFSGLVPSPAASANAAHVDAPPRHMVAEVRTMAFNAADFPVLSGPMGGAPGAMAAPGDLSALEGHAPPPAFGGGTQPMDPNLMAQMMGQGQGQMMGQGPMGQAPMMGQPQGPMGQGPWAGGPPPGPALQPWEVQQPKKGKLGLVLAALIALLIAAGVTFVLLKLRAG